MSCCGSKRKEWLDEVKSLTPHSLRENSSPGFARDKHDKTFEYLGNNSLAIKGAASGKLYHFRFKGDQLAVDYMDSLPLMAKRDLKIVSLPQGDE